MDSEGATGDLQDAAQTVFLWSGELHGAASPRGFGCSIRLMDLMTGEVRTEFKET
jgi:hypothetical protein